MLVRADLSPSQQAVQACHACLEAGKQHPWQGEHPHLVLLTVPDEDSLRRWLGHVQAYKLKAVPFLEPDLGGSLTAFAVSGVQCKSVRQLFSGIPTLKLGTITKEKTMAAFESRFGFHPCSKELFLKLRRLNFLAFEARRRLAAWKRWVRKDPQNRRRFVGMKDNARTDWRLREVPKMHRVFEAVPEPVRPPVDLETAKLIAAEYQNARVPVVQSQVRNLILSEQRIDALLKSLEGWYAGGVISVEAVENPA